MNNIAPLFIKQNVLFLIVGRVIPGEKITENVICTGPVENDKLYFFLSIADLAINPIPYGSGSNIKMFEYLAAGLPIVSTQNGVMGIHKNAIKDISVVTMENFSREISRLLKNRKLLNEFSQKSKQNVKYHDYTYITRNSFKHYQKLL